MLELVQGIVKTTAHGKLQREIQGIDARRCESKESRREEKGF